MRSRRVVRGEPGELVVGLERRMAQRRDVPVDPTRRTLYTPGELYDAAAYDDTLDARAYRWAAAPRTPEAALCRALHDHAIDVALERWIGHRRLVGVMGGHGIERDEPAYADAARLGALLGASHVVATGGGPGAMEAANLGGYLSGRPDALEEALALLATVPTFRPSVDAWARVALELLAQHPDGAPGLGIPTWHYGHEPPNVFATAIAKYFRNSQREAILLEVCDAGIVFLPGLAGTVQEVFQDACENFYAAESAVAPMVLVGATYWTRTLPAWPLLQALARGRAMERHVHLVESVDEAAELISAT
ncbi:LOG family protein [Nocardioides sp. YIM 152315]|uniref:LOG family protein n=1 Tax=Nocardioides sp. YIM 152315 TaxID=3031760 RepID=UPI0023DCCE93|nr:LOG family protein [Nocardioides sp. YIM 152315]MDF1602791.1 LOG family protein [Nocardioides sp. YIM 152315]